MTVVHPEEALLLVGVLGEAVEEEGADTDSSLRHVIKGMVHLIYKLYLKAVFL